MKLIIIHQIIDMKQKLFEYNFKNLSVKKIGIIFILIQLDKIITACQNITKKDNYTKK